MATPTFSFSVYQEMTILLFLTPWMETLLICRCFTQYSNFAHNLNLLLWMENQRMLGNGPYTAS